MPQTVILKEAVVCIATHAKFLEGRLLNPITEMAGHRLERQSREESLWRFYRTKRQCLSNPNSGKCI